MAVVLLVVALVLLDLLVLRYGRDSRPDVAAAPERWVGSGYRA